MQPKINKKEEYLHFNLKSFPVSKHSNLPSYSLNNYRLLKCKRSNSRSHLLNNYRLLKCKRSQTAIEFIMLTGVIIFFFTIFFISINENMGDKIRERRNLEIEKIATSVQDEINLASKSSKGYSRQFKVPYDINGEEYDINITGGMVYVRTLNNKQTIAISIPNITGQIKKGDNLIKNEADKVYLNP